MGAAGTGFVYEATLREEGSVKRYRSSIRGGLQGCVPRALTLRRIAGDLRRQPIGVARPLCCIAGKRKEIARGRWRRVAALLDVPERELLDAIYG